MIAAVICSVVEVLIETLWNVNESNGTWHKSPKVGINRNIVECKYAIIPSKILVIFVLIETLWNVNA